MKFIADLHVHSKHSRATAKNLDLENLYIAGQLKGITVLGTGDVTHPVWFSEIKEKLVPAHIWTPWFSMLGSKSGFDSIQECFEDLTPHVFAVETGLSSDPEMNWRVNDLDGLTLISNSDAHSPMKLGREANIFNTDLSYLHIKNAIKTGDPIPKRLTRYLMNC